MMAWLQVWWIVLHGLFSQSVYPFPGPVPSVPPIPLTGMLIWYEADVGSNCSGGTCSDGATQDTWADQSGNGTTGHGDNTLKLGTGVANCQSGVYHTNQINGKPAVTFASATPTCFAHTAASNLSAASAFVVLTWTSACLWTTGANACDVMGSNGGGLNWFPGHSSGHPLLLKACTSLIATSTATTTSGAWYQENFTYDSSSGAWAFRVNQAGGGSGTNIQTISGGQTGIGGNGCATGSEDFLQGQMAEFILYNRVLSGGEITTVETYLNGKYGL